MGGALSKSAYWFPFCIGDYLADTMQLTTELHGGYLLLMLAYYSARRPLVDDDHVLAGIVKQPLERWKAAFRPHLVHYFNVAGGLWRHERIDRELEKREARSEAGRRGMAARFQTDAAVEGITNPQQTDNKPITKRHKSQSQSQPQSQSQSKKTQINGYVRANPPTVNEIQAYIDEIGSGISALEFFNKHVANGWVVGKGQLMKDWKATVRYWEQVRTGRR